MKTDAASRRALLTVVPLAAACVRTLGYESPSIQASRERSTSVCPVPVFRGDHVWAEVRDELDVSYVVRFRLEERGEG